MSPFIIVIRRIGLYNDAWHLFGVEKYTQIVFLLYKDLQNNLEMVQHQFSNPSRHFMVGREEHGCLETPEV